MTAPRISLSRQHDAAKRAIDILRAQGARKLGMRESELDLLVGDLEAAAATIWWLKSNESEIRAAVGRKKEGAAG